MKIAPLFDERRAAQAAAYLLWRAGGHTSVLSLTKLMYLAERESFKRYSEPLTGDTPVSMKHGPVLSTTLDLMRGLERSAVEGGWDKWIADKEEHMLALRDPSMIKDIERDLDQLSPADIEILDQVWAEVGHLHTDPWALVRYCHTQCDEWEDPGNSSFEIPLARLLRSVGYDHDKTRAALAHVEELMGLHRALG